MYFTDAYSLTRTAQDDWFDPILEFDTKLFIDPFLIFRFGENEFEHAHHELITFFDEAYRFAATSGNNLESLSYKKLRALVIFPEVHELCLGYTSQGIKGAGTAGKFAKQIAEALLLSVELGLKHLDHFEEIGIFNKGISNDRISDITANILKPLLVAYTQAVCVRHNVQTQSFALDHVGYDREFKMWRDEVVDLPMNPYTGSAVLLVPERFLRQGPTINADDFKDYLFGTKGDVLRDELNYELKSKVDKEEIIAIARTHREWVAEYVKWIENYTTPSAYDLAKDPAGLYQWARYSALFSKANPLVLASATSAPEVRAVVNSVVRQYQQFVELNAGYKLLWNDGTGKAKTEEAAQLLFLGIAKHYCRANDIDITRESNIGRGPVDFKFSSGYRERVLLEVKLASNTKFWNGLRKQLPLYMKAEDVTTGHFLVICYTDAELRAKKKTIESALSEVRAMTGYDILATFVDATPHKPSASKL